MMPHKIASFSFDDVHLAAEEQIGLHRHSTWELSYIIAGGGTRLVGDHTEPFTSGEVVLIPPDIPHCWYFDHETADTQGKIANLTITFSTTFLDNCSHAFPELHEHIDRLKEKQNAVKFDNEKSDTIISILENMRRKNHAERVSPMINLLLLIAHDEKEHIIGKYQKTDKEKERLNQIQTYVICNARRHITIEDMARHVGMNRTSFCVFFKKATGKTFIAYLNEYRVELACQLLEQHKMTVSEICYHTGFNNVPYFNRVFKRHKGIPPSAYTGKET